MLSKHERRVIIVRFIVTNRECNFTEIRKALSTEYNKDKPTAMNIKTLKSHLNYLIEQKHIICFEKKDEKVYDVNYEKLDSYPDIKEELTDKVNNHEYNVLKTIKSEFFCHLYLRELIEQKIEINSKISFQDSKDSLKVSKKDELLKKLASALVHDGYLTDPKIWYKISKLENFEINIKLSEISEIINLIKKKIIPLALAKQEFPPNYRDILYQYYEGIDKKEKITNFEDLRDLFNSNFTSNEDRLQLFEKIKQDKLSIQDSPILLEQFGKKEYLLIKNPNMNPSLIKIDPETREKLIDIAKEREKIQGK